MLKPAHFVAVSLALCIYLAPRAECQKRPTKHAYHSPDNTNNPTPFTVPRQIDNQWVYAEAQHRESESPRWYKSPEWALVIIGVITAIFIGWQSLETHRTATVGQKAAEAALQNTQAVINAERPWVTIDVESPESEEFIFIATNVGRTPADIKVIWSGWILAGRGQPISLAPEYSKDDSLLGYPPCLLPPGKDCWVGRWGTEQLQGPELAKNVGSGTVLVYFYGKVVYFDALSCVRHETHWFYRFWPHTEGNPIFGVDAEHPQYNGYRDYKKGEQKAN